MPPHTSTVIDVRNDVRTMGSYPFSAQTAENLDYPDEFFDIIVGVNILHHVDMARSVPEIHRVLKKGGTAIFRDSLATPIRTGLRKSRPVQWIFKSHSDGTEDERPLISEDVSIMRSHFDDLTIQRFRVLGGLRSLFGHGRFLERCDWKLFTALPFMRRLGDHIVIVMKKNSDSGNGSV